MLKVWRGKKNIFAECTQCGSYGTAPHLQPEVRMAPEIEEALERHTAHMMTLREHFTKAANNITMQVRDGSMTRDVGAQKIRELSQNHVQQVTLADAALPNPEGKITEFVTACPWCKAVGVEVEVENLPDDVIEPDFTLAQSVKAAAIAAARKGK